MPSGPGVRVDTHIEAGDRVPAEYDNLIAKMMVHAHDRDAAIDRLRRALDETEIGGVQTTLPFHRFVARSEAFRAGDLSTGWVEQHWDGDAAQAAAVRKALLATGLASVTDEPGPAGVVMTTVRGCAHGAGARAQRMAQQRARPGSGPMAELTMNGDPRPAAGDPRAVRVGLDAESHPGDARAIRVSPVAGPLQMMNPTVGRGPFGGAAMAPQDLPPGGVSAQRQFLVDDAPSDATIRSQGRGRYLLEEASGPTRVVLEAASVVAGGIRRREVLVDGFRFVVDVESERIAALRERASRGRRPAPMAARCRSRPSSRVRWWPCPSRWATR